MSWYRRKKTCCEQLTEILLGAVIDTKQRLIIIDKQLKDLAADAKKKDIQLNVLNDKLDHIYQLLQALSPKVMHIQFQGEQPDMPGTETDIQTIPATAFETDAAGAQLQLNPANVTWAIEDPTIAEMTQNADGSATFRALKPGVTNVTCTDNLAGITGSDTLTVTTSAATGLVLQFGTPVDQAPATP